MFILSTLQSCLAMSGRDGHIKVYWIRAEKHLGVNILNLEQPHDMLWATYLCMLFFTKETAILYEKSVKMYLNFGNIVCVHMFSSHKMLNVNFTQNYFGKSLHTYRQSSNNSHRGKQTSDCTWHALHVSCSTLSLRWKTCTWIAALLKWRTYLWLGISRKNYKTMTYYWLHELIIISHACYKNTNHSEIVWFTGKWVLVRVEKVV